ncbi:MAG TPA: hypothetical protein VGB63_07580 [Pedobacter sp.]|jgi:hypothetical protein
MKLSFFNSNPQLRALLIFSLLMYSFGAISQDRVLVISRGSSLLGAPKTYIENLLKSRGYNFYKNVQNLYSYKKLGNDIVIASYNKSNRVNAVSWFEDKSHYESALIELESYGYKLQREDPALGCEWYGNKQQNLKVIMLLQGEQDGFRVTLGYLNESKAILEPIKSIILPDPKKAVLSKSQTHLTKTSKADIISFYRKFGLKNLYGNNFYLPFFESGEDACILVQIEQKGQYNLIRYSMQCD